MSETRDRIAETEDYLRLLSQEARERLCARLGVEGTGSPSQIADGVYAASHGPDVADVVLRLLGTDLSQAAERLLICWALRGPQDLASILKRGDPHTPDALVNVEARKKASAELQSRGLCALGVGARVLLPGAYRPLAEYGICLYGLDLAGVTAQAAPPPFSLALAVGLSDVEQLLVKGNGALHASSLERLTRRLGGRYIAGHLWDAAMNILCELGVLVVREFGATGSVHVDVAAVRETFSKDATAMAQAALWPGSGGRTALWTYARVLVAARRAARAGAEPGVTIHDILAAKVVAPYKSHEQAGRVPPDPWDTVRMLRTLVQQRVLEPVPDSEPLRLVVREPPPHGSAPWVVQPTFDVLVPWDAPPLRVALLGLCADLEHVDRVCRYRLSPESIARGLEHLQRVDAIVALLEEGAGAPLDPNVRDAIRGWAGSQRPLRSVCGELLLVADAAQAAAIRELAPEARWLTDDVVLLREATLEPILAKARALGIPIATTEGSAPRRSGLSPVAAGQASTRTQHYLNQVLADGAVEGEDPRSNASRTPPAPTRAASKLRYLRELIREAGIDIDADAEEEDGPLGR